MTSRLVAVASIIAAALHVSCAPEAAVPPAAPSPVAGAPDDHRHHHHQHGAGGPHHSHDGPLVHRFENAEQWVKEFDNPERDAWQKPADVITALSITPGMTVADVGAGTGYFLPHLSRAVGPKGKVLGLDIEPGMVAYMAKRATREGLANVEARAAKLDDPVLPAGGVDRVLIVDTWHHIAERPAYAAKLAAGLKPGGAVFVVDFKLDARKGPPPQHRLPPEQVAEELRKGGLAPQILDVKLPEQYIVAGRKQ